MRDLFLDCLPILDALEVSASTGQVARWLHCDQSSVSRSYRRVSEQLGLAFCKLDGQYQACRNLTLLTTLRQASQLRRLDGDGHLLQWVVHPDLPLNPIAAPWRPPLPRSWQREQRSLDLLQRRVLDLVVVPHTAWSAAGQDGATVSAVSIELATAPGELLCALVLPDLADHPSIRQLIAAIATAGRPARRRPHDAARSRTPAAHRAGGPQPARGLAAAAAEPT